MTEEFCIELPRQVPRNPEPAIVNGGDCGACCIAGVLGITVEQAYELHLAGCYAGGEPIPQQSTVDVESLYATLEQSGMTDHVLEGMFDVSPLDYQPPGWQAFGRLPHFSFRLHFELYRALLSAGYYRICTVSNGGKGLESGWMCQQTNHWIMVRGARGIWSSPSPTSGSRRYKTEILLSNSARNQPHAQWADMKHFLQSWGGMVGVWVKPKAAPELHDKEPQ